MSRTLVPALLSALAACVATPPRVTVTPAGPGLPLAPRAPDCEIEFYRTRPPERAYDEVAALLFEAQIGGTPATAQEELRREACAVGADAVVVTRDWAAGVMTGTAVSYRDMREKHRADAAARKAEADRDGARFAEDRRALQAQADAAGDVGPPADFIAGRAKESVRPRITADRRATELDEIRAGAPVWMAPRPSAGWRRVWRPGVRTCWVEEGTVEPLPGPATSPVAGEARQPTSR